MMTLFSFCLIDQKNNQTMMQTALQRSHRQWMRLSRATAVSVLFQRKAVCWQGSRMFCTNSKVGRVSAAVVQQQQLLHSNSDRQKSQEQNQDKNKCKNKSKSIDLSPPKGTRDFYPDDMQFRSWLFDKWTRIATSFGYQLYDAPVLETEDLYVVKSGEEIRTQLFNFTDKGGRQVALRPEMTPSLARMILARRGALAPSATQPLRWTALPQCWRYEKTTRGRRREHYQWNMDIWGVPGVEAEAELISALVTAFKTMGLSSADLTIKVSSRKLLTCVFECLSLPPASFTPLCVLIDKGDKMPASELRHCLRQCLYEHGYRTDPSDDPTVLESTAETELGELGMESTAGPATDPTVSAAAAVSVDDGRRHHHAELQLLIRSKVDTLLNWLSIDSLPLLRETLAAELLHQAEQQLSQRQQLKQSHTRRLRAPEQILRDGFADIELLFELLGPAGYNLDENSTVSGDDTATAVGSASLSTSSWVKFDAGIVRGLAYYTGVVFEASDREGKLRAICGGGRYDALSAALLGQDDEKEEDEQGREQGTGDDVPAVTAVNGNKANKNKNKGQGQSVAIPAVGFGFGDAVIYELLQSKGLLPQLPPARARASEVLVWSPSGDFACPESGRELALLRSRAIQITAQLRQHRLQLTDAPCVTGVECVFGSSVPTEAVAVTSAVTNNAGVATTASDGNATATASVTANAVIDQAQSKQLKAILKRADRTGSRVAVLCTLRDLRESNSFVIKDMSASGGQGQGQFLCSYDTLLSGEAETESPAGGAGRSGGGVGCSGGVAAFVNSLLSAHPPTL